MWAEQYIHFYHLSVTVIRHLRLRSPSNLELSLITFYFNCKSNVNLIWFSCFSGFIWCFIFVRHQTSNLAVHHGSIKHFPAVWKSSCRNVMKIRCNAVRMRQRSCTELSLALWQTAVKWVMGAAGCCSRHPVSLRVNWIRCVQEAPPPPPPQPCPYTLSSNWSNHQATSDPNNPTSCSRRRINSPCQRVHPSGLGQVASKQELAHVNQSERVLRFLPTQKRFRNIICFHQK